MAHLLMNRNNDNDNYLDNDDAEYIASLGLESLHSVLDDDGDGNDTDHSSFVPSPTTRQQQQQEQQQREGINSVASSTGAAAGSVGEDGRDAIMTYNNTDEGVVVGDDERQPPQEAAAEETLSNNSGRKRIQFAKQHHHNKTTTTTTAASNNRHGSFRSSRSVRGRTSTRSNRRSNTNDQDHDEPTITSSAPTTTTAQAPLIAQDPAQQLDDEPSLSRSMSGIFYLDSHDGPGPPTNTTMTSPTTSPTTTMAAASPRSNHHRNTVNTSHNNLEEEEEVTVVGLPEWALELDSTTTATTAQQQQQQQPVAVATAPLIATTMTTITPTAAAAGAQPLVLNHRHGHPRRQSASTATTGSSSSPTTTTDSSTNDVDGDHNRLMNHDHDKNNHNLVVFPDHRHHNSKETTTRTTIRSRSRGRSSTIRTVGDNHKQQQQQPPTRTRTSAIPNVTTTATNKDNPNIDDDKSTRTSPSKVSLTTATAATSPAARKTNRRILRKKPKPEDASFRSIKRSNNNATTTTMVLTASSSSAVPTQKLDGSKRDAPVDAPAAIATTASSSSNPPSCGGPTAISIPSPSSTTANDNNNNTDILIQTIQEQKEKRRSSSRRHSSRSRSSSQHGPRRRSRSRSSRDHHHQDPPIIMPPKSSSPQKKKEDPPDSLTSRQQKKEKKKKEQDPTTTTSPTTTTLHPAKDSFKSSSGGGTAAATITTTTHDKQQPSPTPSLPTTSSPIHQNKTTSRRDERRRDVDTNGSASTTKTTTSTKASSPISSAKKDSPTKQQGIRRLAQQQQQQQPGEETETSRPEQKGSPQEPPCPTVGPAAAADGQNKEREKQQQEGLTKVKHGDQSKRSPKEKKQSKPKQTSIQWLSPTPATLSADPANLSPTSEEKVLPLHAALHNGASLSELYKLISAAKLDPSIMEKRDRMGNTPLHIACMIPKDHHPQTTTTSSAAAAADTKDHHQRPQHPYFENDSLLLVIQLLYNLCPQNIQRANKEGQLPLHLAILSAAAARGQYNHAWSSSSSSSSNHSNSIMCMNLDTTTCNASVASSTKDKTCKLWLDIIAKMIFEYPKALHIANNNGQVPLDLAIHNAGTCPELVALIQAEIALLGDNFSSVGGETKTTLSSVNKHGLLGRRHVLPPIHPNTQHHRDACKNNNDLVGSRICETDQAASPTGPSPPRAEAPEDPFEDEEAEASPSGDNCGNERNDLQKPPPILFEMGDYVRMGNLMQTGKFNLWGIGGNSYGGFDLCKVANSKVLHLAAFLLIFTGLLFLPKPATHRPIRVAFIGNSITFVNDLPRFMEALSNGYISQNSCLHGATRLRTILNTGNGMYNKWRTNNAFIMEISEDDDLYNYVAADDDEVDDDEYMYWVADDDNVDVSGGQHIIFDYGACSIPQLLFGTDEYLVEYNDNGYYRNDGKNPCIRDPAYLQYQKMRYSEMVRDHRLEQSQESDPDTVLHLWDYVVLNDQTLVPAIDEEREKSEEVLKYVYAPYLKQIKARPVLLMTHGYSYNASVQFDSGYDHIWTDIPTFSSALYQGYQGYAEVLSQTLPPEQAPLLAPAGLAYLVVWEENRSMWERLFFVDGFHPTPHGTFLIGCVLYATLYNKMPANIPQDVEELWSRARKMQIGNKYEMPIPTQDEAIYLATIAERVVLKKYMPKSYIYDLNSSA